MHIIPLAGLTAMAWTMCAVAILLTVGRFIIRWRTVRKVHWDDILNGAALLALIGFVATFQVYLPVEYNEELYGLGLSDVAPTEDDLNFSLKMTLANVILFWAVIFLVKASFLALYWQLFRVSPRFRKAWWMVTIYTVLSALVILLSEVWRCNDPKNRLNLAVCAKLPEHVIISIVTLWCVLTVVGDLLIVALPLGMLKPLQIPRPQKLGLAAIFTIVVIDIVFDILRSVYTASSYLSNFPDANAAWALCEPTIAVIVCTLPTYRILFSKQNRFSKSSQSRARDLLSYRQGFHRQTEMDDLSSHQLNSSSELGH